MAVLGSFVQERTFFVPAKSRIAGRRDAEHRQYSSITGTLNVTSDGKGDSPITFATGNTAYPNPIPLPPDYFG